MSTYSNSHYIRWWAIALPLYLFVLLLCVFVIYPALGTMIAAPRESLLTVADRVMPSKSHAATPHQVSVNGALPLLSDIPIGEVNSVLYDG